MGLGFCLFLGFRRNCFYVFNRRHCRQFAVMHHRMDDAISLGFISRKIIITLGIGCDFFYLLASHTGQDVKKVAADTQRDYYFSSNEAKAYGIIDSVMHDRKLQAVPSIENVKTIPPKT